MFSSKKLEHAKRHLVQSAQLGLTKDGLSKASAEPANGEDMATGWAHEGAVLDQIEDTITDGVLTARARLPVGEGAEHCVECGDDIPEARRKALPGARTCVSCQSGRDSRIVLVGVNRRGSKDSQLR
jgi:phage/conjugal plasmid C-4 type zinc finger TraR family protein